MFANSSNSAALTSQRAIYEPTTTGATGGANFFKVINPNGGIKTAFLSWRQANLDAWISYLHPEVAQFQSFTFGKDSLFPAICMHMYAMLKTSVFFNAYYIEHEW